VRKHTSMISPKQGGFGSSINGGELLILALATCSCNDIYREARRRGIEVRSVEAEVSGEAEATSNISDKASVAAKASQDEILALMRHTDSVAEIQNTLRHSSPVILAQCEAREV